MAKKKNVAFAWAMTSQRRLGNGSPANLLNSDMLQKIAKHAGLPVHDRPLEQHHCRPRSPTPELPKRLAIAGGMGGH
eukprot:168191-Rhodomonas_salina.2